ncbi:DUF4150 domain-containing protein [Rhizobium lemnae]|uniref:PAAR-like domain-containing protein n=1 Tax=Rhizobium lemnae TaxID=1214924 RepID=A0ABV8EAL3_9HYPH|nr:DUF4150 domain-containing protein [Rhizobium lemnae]
MDFCGHDDNYTPSVRFTGKKAMVMRSRTTHVHGDAPGTRKGIKSGTVESVCEPIGHADQVCAEGSHVIRHLDRFKMNSGNTVGEAQFVRSTKTYEPPVDDDPVPGSLRWQNSSDEGRVMSDASPEPLIMGAQYAQALPQIAPQTVPTPSAPAPRPPGQVIRPNVPQWNRPPPVPEAPLGKWLARLGTFGRFAGPVAAFVAGMWPASTAMPWHDEMPQDDFEEALFKRARELEQQGVSSDAISEWFNGERLHHAQRKMEDGQRRPQAIPQSETVRVDEREEYRKKCQVDRYAKMKNICGQYGMQAHHIVPDWTLRTGARSRISDRIPNMPSLNDGMAIWVVGNAREEETEHWEGHLADRAIEDIGKNSNPLFTAKLSQVRNESSLAMIKVRPDCAKQILTAMAEQFAGKNPNQLLRAKQYPPLPEETVSALKAGAVAGANVKP